MSGRTDGARRTGPAVEAMYRFLLWLVPAVEKFPRSQKFLLGDRIQATGLDVLERLAASAAAPALTRSRAAGAAARTFYRSTISASACRTARTTPSSALTSQSA